MLEERKFKSLSSSIHSTLNFVFSIDNDLIAVTSIGSDLISINFSTLGLIEVTSSFLPVDLEATPIFSANESRFGLMKSSIRSGRFRGGVEISDGNEAIAKLLNAL